MFVNELFYKSHVRTPQNVEGVTGRDQFNCLFSGRKHEKNGSAGR